MKKKTRKKEYDRFFIEEFFKKPWCPLFGLIFWNDEPLPPSSQIERCFTIIQEARRLWETEDANGIDRSLGGLPSWPEPEEIPDYPKDLILAARAISRSWIAMEQTVIGSYQPDAYYKKENGDFEPIHTLDTAWDRVKRHAKSMCHPVYFDKDGTLKTIYKFEDIPDFAILAIHAITEARNALSLIIQDGKPEENSEVLKHVQVAGSLLARAKEEKYDEEIKFKEKKIEEMQPIVEYGKKFKDGPKKPRKDSLSKIIEDTYLTLKEKEKKPTAKEVFNALPLNECIQDKDEDGDMMIYWKTHRGREKETAYKTFLNRLTRIKNSCL